MIEWPERLALARLPTPLTRLERYSKQFDGVTIWVKRDELTGTEVSGNKVRKLEFTLAQALAQSCDTLITCGGLQSNHCRATAIIGARLGLKVHLLLRGGKPQQAQGNLLLDQLCGAQISYLPPAQYQAHQDLAAELARDYHKAGHKAYFIPVGASDEVGLWGYIAASEELKQDFTNISLEPEYIVTATGSGGTQAGLIAGCELFSINSQVMAVNVCDDAQYFETKIRADFSLWKSRYKIDLDTDQLKINTLDDYVGPGYGMADKEVYDCIAGLARSEGLFLDPVYTGKAFHGMVSELRKGPDGRLAGARNIVFIHTGGLFGLFPHQSHFG